MPENDLSDATVLSEDKGAAARFCIQRCLGSGGMGAVYLAEDSKLHRLVAIKTIRSDLCKNEEIRKRIERECLLHAKVGPHPHIVTLFDKIEDGDKINLVMEYVEGETLQHFLEEKVRQGARLSVADAINIAAQCLEALSRIHAHGIVHRDIKPPNLMLSLDDSGVRCAKLMDFGIARLQRTDEEATCLTQADTGGPGTPTYMAPEQIDPKSFGSVSYATDVYAMGIMLYQLLSGRPPFFGTLTEIFNGHLNCPPPPLKLDVPGTVPETFFYVVERALAKHPTDRFPSAKAFRDELLRILPTIKEGPVAGPDPAVLETVADSSRTLLASGAALPGAVEKGSTLLAGAAAGRPARRGKSRAAWAAVALVVLLATGGALAFYVFQQRQPEDASVAPDEVPVASDIMPTSPLAELPAVPAPEPVALPVQPAAPLLDGPAVPVPAPETTPAPTEPAASGSAMDALVQGLERRAESAPTEPRPAPKPAAPTAESQVKQPATPEPEPKPKPKQEDADVWKVEGISSYKRE